MLRFEKTMNKTCKRCGLTDRYRSGQCRPCTVERQNQYWATNLPMRLANAQRTRITGAFKSQGLSVPRKVFALLGCTALALVAHIESQFVEGMSWANYPIAWEVDHINPLSQHTLADPQQAAQACSFLNLRPLSVTEHKQKSKLEGLSRVGSKANPTAFALSGSQEEPTACARRPPGASGVLLAGVLDSI